MVAIAKRYSGEQGTALLLEQGYPPEMVEATGGAGTRTFKCRGGMGLLGVIGKYGMYRFANTLALLDQACPRRGAGGGAGRPRRGRTTPGTATRRPGTPSSPGLQASDERLQRPAQLTLHIQCGKNLVENKMPESHFFIEVMERGGKIVTITPEYSPAGDEGRLLDPDPPGDGHGAVPGRHEDADGQRELYDVDFVKRFTDLPAAGAHRQPQAPAGRGGVRGLPAWACRRTAPASRCRA